MYRTISSDLIFVSIRISLPSISTKRNVILMLYKLLHLQLVPTFEYKPHLGQFNTCRPSILSLSIFSPRLITLVIQAILKIVVQCINNAQGCLSVVNHGRLSYLRWVGRRLETCQSRALNMSDLRGLDSSSSVKEKNAILYLNESLMTKRQASPRFPTSRKFCDLRKTLSELWVRAFDK